MGGAGASYQKIAAQRVFASHLGLGISETDCIFPVRKRSRRHGRPSFGRIWTNVYVCSVFSPLNAIRVQLQGYLSQSDNRRFTKRVVTLCFRYENFRMREDDVDVEANALAEELTSLGRSTVDHKPIQLNQATIAQLDEWECLTGNWRQQGPYPWLAVELPPTPCKVPKQPSSACLRQGWYLCPGSRTSLNIVELGPGVRHLPHFTRCITSRLSFFSRPLWLPLQRSQKGEIFLTLFRMPQSQQYARVLRCCVQPEEWDRLRRPGMLNGNP